MRLRTVLDDAGYDEAGLGRRVERDRDVFGRVGLEQLAGVRFGTSPLDVLTRLFTLRTPVPVSDAEVALGPECSELLTALGLAAVANGALAPRMVIELHGGLRIIGDLSLDPAAFDHVAPWSHTTALCAELTIRTPVERALDLGSGSGVQALLLATHAHSVVATDVNPRALELTAANAVLNGRTNIDVREGSLYGPVGAERFDVIACNAPYVVSPDHRFAFRDGPDTGDELTADVVRGLYAHLEPGGFATLTGSWIQRAGEPALDRIAQWLDPKADLLVLTARSLEPDIHAALWNLPLAGEPDASLATTIDRWRKNAAELGAERINEGAIVVRRPRTDDTRPRGWRREEALGVIRRGTMAAHVEDIFKNATAVCALTDDQLLAAPLALAPRTVLRAHSRRVGDDVITTDGRVQSSEGLEMEAYVDPFTLDVLRRLDGRAPLAQRVCEAAKSQDVDTLLRDAAHIAREMVSSGLLELCRRPGVPSSG